MAVLIGDAMGREDRNLNRRKFDMLRVWIVLLMVAGRAAKADVLTFETPSENTQCVVGEDHVGSDIRCVIIRRSGPPALPRPANCATDWGHAFFMNDHGPVQMVCEPLSQARDGFERAQYGVTGRFGGFTCLSERSGLTCRNESGHGFFLSRAWQSVF